MNVRHACGMSAVLTALTATPAPAQELYPARPIRLVVAIPAGSGTDTVARLIADGLSQRLGARVVVDNRPGGGTIIGNEIVAKAKADGYTLLMNGAALAIAPSMYRKVPYDTARDIIAKLHAETVAVVRDADISRKLIEGGADIVASTPDELAAFFQAELAKWPGVIRAAGLSPTSD